MYRPYKITRTQQRLGAWANLCSRDAILAKSRCTAHKVVQDALPLRPRVFIQKFYTLSLPALLLGRWYAKGAVRT